MKIKKRQKKKKVKQKVKRKKKPNNLYISFQYFFSYLLNIKIIMNSIFISTISTIIINFMQSIRIIF